MVSYELAEGTYNAEKFCEFLSEEFFSTLSDRQVSVMGNAKFHHSKTVKTLFQNSPHSLRYLPPYSPQLNLIEEFSFALKSRYTNLPGSTKSKKILKERVNEILEKNDILMAGFYANA